MKYTYLSILAMILLVACDKKKDNTTPTTTAQLPDSSYIINGIQNINIGLFEVKKIPLAIQYTNKGAQELINLSAEGAPNGVHISFDPNGAVPSFASVMTVDSKAPFDGTYPITIMGTSASGKKKEYQVSLTVSGKLDKCGETVVLKAKELTTKLKGSNEIIYAYTKLRHSSPTEYRIEDLVLRHNNSPKEVVIADDSHIKNFAEVKIVFDCEKRTLTIPEVKLSVDDFGASHLNTEYTVSGSGTFVTGELDITYTSKSKHGTFTYHATAPINW